jgi:carotenoid cleavage dioxygenase
MNLVTGETKEEPLDDLNVEFCLPDTERYGVKTRYSYHQYIPTDLFTVEFHGLVKYDHESGARRRYDYGDANFASEAPFARRIGGTDEDDGYVTTIVTNANDHTSQCWVFRAQDIERGPIAKVKLPARVPVGFHAKWIPGERLWPS